VPGHLLATRFQESGDLRFCFQNGQVLHCAGLSDVVFDNGGFEAEAFEVIFVEMVGGAIEEISDELYFPFSNPDETLLRS